MDCAVVVVGKGVDLATVAIFVDSADLLSVITRAAGAEPAGQSSTYVVSPPPSSPTDAALSVGSTSETPPYPSETTKIVTVCTVAISLTEAPTDDGAKIFAVPAAVIVGTLEVEEEDAAVELA